MIKKIVIIILIILAVAAIFFGSYLPYQKAQLFINAYRALGSSQQFSFDDFKTIFDRALNFYSPVGQEEEVRFLGNQILDLVQRKPPEEILKKLQIYAEETIGISIRDSRGLNYTQNFLILGGIYQMSWSFYKNPADLEKAISYYESGLKLSPDRPQFLFALFDLYRASGRNEDVKPVGEKIMKFWPSSFQPLVDVKPANEK
ncbi:MAG: hypothetical protein QMD65_00690 [Patescibacteria group bacterium]|nr:hypothetical protein [Patescibacteria group bacterium]